MINKTCTASGRPRNTVLKETDDLPAWKFLLDPRRIGDLKGPEQQPPRFAGGNHGANDSKTRPGGMLPEDRLSLKQ